MAHLEVKPRSRSNWWIWLIIVIVIIAAAYYFWSSYSGKGKIVVNRTDSPKTVTTTDSAATHPAK
jgi:flagellar basal body-associated protein FliL